MEKLREWLQNKRYSLMGESLLPWTLSPIGDEIPKSSPSDLKMTLSFAIIGIIVAAILNL